MIPFRTVTTSVSLLAIAIGAAVAGSHALAASAPATFTLSQSMSSGAVCQATGNYGDPAAQVPHAKAWTITCRGWGDVPFGHVYTFDASGPSPLAPISVWQTALRERATCAGGQPANIGIPGATVSDCATTAGKVPYKVYQLSGRRTIAIAEGMSALSDLVELALKVAAGVSPAPSAAASQATAGFSNQAAADLRVAAEAARRSPDYARRQGYLLNQGWSFDSAEENFRQLATDQAAAPADRALAQLNWALNVSNQGRFADADVRFAEAEQSLRTLNDPQLSALALNYRAMHLLNQRKINEAERPASDAIAMRASIDPTLMSGTASTELQRAPNGDFHIPLSISAELNEGNILRSNIVGPAQRLKGQTAQAYYVIGAARSAMGDADGARENLERANQLITEARLGRSMAWQRASIYRELARLDTQAGRNDQAAMHQLEAVRAYQVQPDLRARPAEAGLYMALARTEAIAGQTQQALLDYTTGFDLFRKGRGTVGDSAELTNNYFELLIGESQRNPQRQHDYQSRFFDALQSIVSPETAETIARLAGRLSQSGSAGADTARALEETDRQITIKQSEINRRQESGEYSADQRAADQVALKRLTDQFNADNQQLIGQNRLYGQLRATTATLDAMQAALKPDELYVKTVILSQGGYGIAITNTTTRTFSFSLTRAEAEKVVARIRRPFDAAETLPRFDVAAAHDAYTALFGPVQDLMQGANHLIYDPDGSLVGLPASVFVTDDASVLRFREREAQFLAGRYDLDLYEGIAWLGRNMEISVSVSPSAFLQARAFEPSHAQYAFLGLGDPVVQNTPSSLPVENVALGIPSPAPRALDPRMYRLVVDPANGTNTAACEQVRKALATGLAVTNMGPMMQDVARRLGARAEDVVLHQDFTDTSLLTRQDLNNYKVIFFGTHGLLPTKEDCLPEPALVTSLGPGESDAFLDASEILRLRLDADLVVLAACNTGGAGSAFADRTGLVGSGQALGGLARDFIYAGSRGLVVSQWSVDLNATVALMTAFFDNRGGSQAASFQRAETALMNDKKFSHPYYWAAFSLIGDGARPMPGA